MDLQLALDQCERVEEFRRKHRIGLLTLLFTDMVGSTRLKQTLGDTGGFDRIQEHHALVREILEGFPEGEEIVMTESLSLCQVPWFTFFLFRTASPRRR
jgi:hypothetical protein